MLSQQIRKRYYKTLGTSLTYQPIVPSLSDTIYKRYFHGEFSVFATSTKPSVFEEVEKAYENPNLNGELDWVSG